MTRLLIAALIAGMLTADVACGQGAGQATRAGGQEAEWVAPAWPGKDPPFVASLLLVKADWSQAPAAKEIEAELRGALKDASVPEDLLRGLPASGSRILFPTGVAGYYTAQHYAELLAWLKTYELIVGTIPFGPRLNVDTNVPGANEEFSKSQPGEYAASLLQPYDLLDLPKIDVGDTTPFVKREVAWLWRVRAIPNHSAFFIESCLVQSVMARGQKQPQIEKIYDQWHIWSAFADGNVEIINAFPESNAHAAAIRKGIEVLLVIKRRADEQAQEPRLVLPDEVETIESKTKLNYEFSDPSAASADTAGGTEPAAPSGRNPVAPNDQFRIRVFTLRNARAAEAMRVVRDIFDQNVDSVSVDERTNSVIVRSLPRRESVLDQIDALLNRLDEPDLEKKGPPSPAGGEGAAGGPSLQTSTLAALNELKSRYSAREEAASALATRIRELQKTAKPNKVEVEKLMKQLRATVGEAFAARQELHRAEVSQLRRRIETLGETVSTRDRLHDQIIDQRVKDLLNPDLQWETAESRTSTPRGTSTAAARTTAEAADEDMPGAGPAGPDAASWENIKYTARFGDDSEKIWNTLGVKVKEVRPEDLTNLSFPCGAQILQIRRGSPADGLKAGDIIVMLGGSTFTSVHGLANILARPIQNQRNTNFHPFEDSTISILRGGETLSFTIKFPLAPPPLEPANPNKYGWSPNDENTFAALGLTVQQLSAEDAPAPKYAGAMKITAIAPDSLAKGRLAVGDIVISMMVRGRSALLGVTVRVVRGSEEFTYELPSPSDVPKASERPPGGRNLQGAAAYRDKVRERVRLLEQQLKFGQLSVAEFLKAQVELDDAELAAAPTAEERRKVRDQKVAHLKERVAVVRQLFNIARASQADLLAAEADLLKAEGEVVADAPNENGDQRPGQGGWSPGVRPAASTDSTGTLRSAERFHEALRDAEHDVNQYKELAKSGKTAPDGKSYNDWVARYEQRLDFLRKEYSVQLGLLELDVNDAKSALATAQRARDRTEELVKEKVVSGGELADADQVLQSAQSRLKRAEMLLYLYRKADPQNEAPAPAAEKTADRPKD
jgi:hypothetical protein